jgi:hypothetical protein
MTSFSNLPGLHCGAAFWISSAIDGRRKHHQRLAVAEKKAAI